MLVYLCYEKSLDGVALVNYSPTVNCGSEFYYTAVMCSSTIGRNGPVKFSVTDMNNNSTDIATIGESIGYFKALKAGPVRIHITYDNAPWVWIWNVEIIPKYTLNVVHYYDQGYNARFNNAYQSILSYQEVCSAFFLQLFDLKVVTKIQNYTSCADSCKGTVTSGNLTNGCNHYPIHLTDDAVRNDIISRFGNGTNRLSRIYMVRSSAKWKSKFKFF